MLSLVSFVTPPDKIRFSLLGWSVINELNSVGVVVVPSSSSFSKPRLKSRELNSVTGIFVRTPNILLLDS